MTAKQAPGERDPAYERRMALGSLGELAVRDRLVEQGWEIVALNMRCGRGEIDIVARDGEALVICEVKTLRARENPFLSPLESIGGKKRARIRRTAAAWLAGEPAHDGVGDPVGRPPPTRELRFDAFAVVVEAATGKALIEHVRGAF